MKTKTRDSIKKEVLKEEGISEEEEEEEGEEEELKKSLSGKESISGQYEVIKNRDVWDRNKGKFTMYFLPDYPTKFDILFIVGSKRVSQSYPTAFEKLKVYLVKGDEKTIYLSNIHGGTKYELIKFIAKPSEIKIMYNLL